MRQLLKRINHALNISMVTCLMLSSCSMSQQQVADLYDSAKKDSIYDVIIVPGVPFEGEEWDMTMKMRVSWSYHLYKENVTRNIIYTGSAVYSPYVESRIMSLYAQEMGIPKENIFTEEHAEHSTENVFYSYHMAKELGFKRIALASDPFQSSMLEKFIEERLNNEVKLIPVLYEILETYISKPSPQINPESAFVENFESIVDRESKWKRFKGTRGKNIDYESFENDTSQLQPSAKLP